MANKMRWRYGDTDPVLLPVDSDVKVEISDLLWEYAYPIGKRVLPAIRMDYRGSTEETQWTFADRFSGVAMQASRVGDMGPIRVARRGVFEYDIMPVETSIAVGTRLMIAADELNQSQLSNQRVVVISSSVEEVRMKLLTIGRCAQVTKPGVSKILVDISMEGRDREI